MQKTFFILKREYLQRVKSKWFWIGTVITPLFIIGVIGASVFFATRESRGLKKMAVVDQTGTFAERFKQVLSERRPNIEKELKREMGIPETTKETDKATYEFVETVGPVEDLDGTRSKYTQRILEGKLDGLFVIHEDFLESRRVDYFSKNVSDRILLANFRNALTRTLTETRLQAEGIDPAKVRNLTASARLETFKVTAEGARADRGQQFILGFVLTMMIYTTMLVYGMTTMRSVLEEKTSRVVEVLLSSVRPMEMMVGKVLGVGLVALTQYGIWATLVLLLTLPQLALTRALLRNNPDFSLNLPPSTLLFFVLFFLLGYLLFATMYAAIGAMVNSDEESQQVQFPITMLVIIPILTMNLVLRDPNHPTAVVMSLIPFFTPIIMMMRIAIQPPPFLQIGASIVLMLLTIAFIFWLTAKIYRVGILMYGKRPNLPELWRWLKYS